MPVFAPLPASHRRAYWLLTSAVGSAALLAATGAHAQSAENSVVITAQRAVESYQPPQQVPIGPLGNQSLATSPQSVTVVPSDLILNLQSKTVNDTLRYLPSVEVRDQQGYEVSRPQSRGFQGTVAQNTRMDGFSIVGTSATAAEMLDSVEVMNGLSGALYGPATPAGIFNYQLKRPTDKPMAQFTESFDSGSVLTEHLDAGGRFGPNDQFGLRVNVVSGVGQSWTSDSYEHRTLIGLGGDYHIDSKTTLEMNYVYYDTNVTGLPGSIVYDGISSNSGTSSVLPPAIDPTKIGYGQSGAGADLATNLGSFKIKHRFNDDWTFEGGGLYQDAQRNLFGITNTVTDNAGDYTVTKNFTSVPHFTIGSFLAYLNGRVMVAGFENDVTLGANGFVNGQYNYRNSIAETLGKSNLANPAIMVGKPEPVTGDQYEAGSLTNESVVMGDTLHLNSQWAIQGVLSASWISSRSWSNKDLLTSSDTRNGVISPTVSLTYRPTSQITGYVTYANSVEEGETAPAGAVNANQFLTPYHDEMYEAGVKYAPMPNLLITLDGFRMTRPLAQAALVSPTGTSTIFEVVGTQRNTGAELFVQGGVTPDLSLFGGVTYIDAKLVGSPNPTLNNKWVVGVPEVKADLSADFHPKLFQGAALTASVHAESQRAATGTNNSFAPAYTTFDLGARYTLPVFSKPTTLRLQVINLSDTRYYASIADGTIVGSPGANTAYPGAPRTVQASIEVNF